MPTRRLLAVVHTPITGRFDTVIFSIGTCSAIECTFTNLVALMPGMFPRPIALAKTWSDWNGRRSARSKIEPRST